jgi:hypothetical protein
VTRVELILRAHIQNKDITAFDPLAQLFRAEWFQLFAITEKRFHDPIHFRQSLFAESPYSAPNLEGFSVCHPIKFAGTLPANLDHLGHSQNLKML